MHTALFFVASLLAGAAAVEPPAGGDDIGQRCGVPGQLDDPRAMEVHLRCLLAGLGNPVVLPNPFNPRETDEDKGAADDEEQLFQNYCDTVEDVLRHLEGLKEQIDGRDGGGGKRGTGAAVGDMEELVRSVADAAAAMKGFLEEAAADGGDDRCRDLFQPGDDDAAGATRTVQPDEACRLLRNPAPDGLARPDDADFENGGGEVGIKANLNGHLVPFPRFGSPHKPIERMTSGQVPADGAFVVLKEFFGLRFRLRWRWVPVWQEPWFPRRRIVGYRRRLSLRLVPCEYLKSIVYERSEPGGRVTPNVVVKNWCDHSLLHFWRFF